MDGPSPAYDKYKAVKEARRAESVRGGIVLSASTHPQRSSGSVGLSALRVESFECRSTELAAPAQHAPAKPEPEPDTNTADAAGAPSSVPAPEPSQRRDLTATQALVVKAQNVLDSGGQTAQPARVIFAKALAALPEQPEPPLENMSDGGATGTEVNTYIEIPAADEMMRQMQTAALRMLCVEGLARCDLRLGRWQAAIESATKLIAVAPRDVDAYLIRGRARASCGQVEDAIKDLARARKISPEDRKAECEEVLDSLRRSMRGPAARGTWRPSAALAHKLTQEQEHVPRMPQQPGGGASTGATLAGGSANTAASDRNGGQIELPVVVDITSASGSKFRLFVIRMVVQEGSPAPAPGEVWGGVQKANGAVVKYSGHFDDQSSMLSLKHVDTLAEGGATHAIQGTMSYDQPAKFELQYSQWWADITRIQGGVGGREEYRWSCRIANSRQGAREWSTQFAGKKDMKKAVKYMEKEQAKEAAAIAAAKMPSAASALLEEIFGGGSAGTAAGDIEGAMADVLSALSQRSDSADLAASLPPTILPAAAASAAAATLGDGEVGGGAVNDGEGADSVTGGTEVPLVIPATLDDVFAMAIRLGLVTDQGVTMMRRNIKRGRRSEAHFLAQWTQRIDAELAKRREAMGLKSMPTEKRAAAAEVVVAQGRGPLTAEGHRAADEAAAAVAAAAAATAAGAGAAGSVAGHRSSAVTALLDEVFNGATASSDDAAGSSGGASSAAVAGPSLEDDMAAVLAALSGGSTGSSSSSDVGKAQANSSANVLSMFGFNSVATAAGENRIGVAATASTEGGFEEQIKEARRQLLASLDAKADNAAKSTPSNPLFKADDGGRIGFAPPLQAPMFPPDEPERDEAGNVFEPRPRATTATVARTSKRGSDSASAMVMEKSASPSMLSQAPPPTTVQGSLGVLMQKSWSHPVVQQGKHTLSDPNFDSLVLSATRAVIGGGSDGTAGADGQLRDGVLARFEYRQGPMIAWPPSIWRGNVMEGSSGDGNGMMSWLLEPDVLDRQDVLTMAHTDPEWDVLQSQLFTLTYMPGSDVRLCFLHGFLVV